MVTNYDSCAYKLALPEVNLLEDACQVKITLIGKSADAQIQLAIMSCELTSLKQEVYDVELTPDMLRMDSNARISAVGSFPKPASGFGLVGAKIKICIVDLLNKQKADIFFSRGSDRKWVLSAIELTEHVEIDRSILRERRRKLRRSKLIVK